MESVRSIPHQNQGYYTPDQLQQYQNYANAMPSTAVTPGKAEVTLLQTPFHKYNEAVAANPLDFNSWVQLLALVESSEEIVPEIARSTFNRFLEEFSLCFGYWNKFAEYEQKLLEKGKTEEIPSDVDKRIREIFESGVLAIPYSVEMWQNYSSYLLDGSPKVNIDDGRRILERALEKCGSDPAAGPLWDKYISFETMNNDMAKLNAVFKRVLQQPLQNIEEYWEKYNQFVLSQPLTTLATSEELEQIAAEGQERDEGALRVRVVAAMERLKMDSAAEVEKRKVFEAGIERTYFHVTALKEETITNWKSYLDYEEMCGDKLKVEKLYERCLIACANYSEFWHRYGMWKEKAFGVEASIEVYQRAMKKFVKYRPDIFLNYASLLEAYNRHDEARQTYEYVLETLSPGLAEGICRFANFERRRGNTDAVINLYNKALESTTETTRPFLAMQFSNFQLRVLGNPALCRKTLQDAIGKVTSSKTLWLHYINFEANQGGKDMATRVQGIFASALTESSKLSNEEKCDLWFLYEEYMEDYGISVGDARSVVSHELNWRKSNSITRKRGLEEVKTESSNKQPKYDASAYSQYYSQQQPYQYAQYGTTAAPYSQASSTDINTAGEGYADQATYAAYY